MIEYCRPQRGRDDPYCWICCGYGCESPHQSPGDAATWSPERVTPPVLAGDEPWPWLNGPVVAWWHTPSAGRAA
jgi:hypothetical protein